MRKLLDEAIKLSLGGGADGPDTPASKFFQSVHAATTEHPFVHRARLHGYVAITLTKSVNDRANAVHISDIQSLDPRKGLATQTLQDLCNEADNLSVDLELTAKAYSSKGMNTKQLVEWYKRFGFVVEYGTDEDGYDMIRKAKSGR